MEFQYRHHPQYVYCRSYTKKALVTSAQVRPKMIGLKFMVSGTERYLTDRSNIKLHKGELVLFKPQLGFACENTNDPKGIEGVCIDLAQTAFNSADLHLIERLLIGRKHNAELTGLGNFLKQTGQHPQLSPTKLIEQLKRGISAHCAAMKAVYQNIQHDFKRERACQENTLLLWETQATIAHNSQEPFQLGSLAEKVGLSKFRLLRLFKQAFGQTPLEFHHGIRMQRALRSLPKQPDITQLAYELGYESLAVFSKRFKKTYGVAPSHFQKSNIGQA